MRPHSWLGAFASVSMAYAQNSSYCPGNGVCYTVNVPAASASSGTGDIFFQISGPSNMGWIGLGQGSSMSDANIFFLYPNAAGDNVTLSPRLGIGNQPPITSGTLASVSLLAGSGIRNGIMTANVRCSSCEAWPGGSMSFTDTSSSWIWAYYSQPGVSSDSQTVSLARHNKFGTTTFNLQNAAGGSSPNPFLTSSAVNSVSSPASSSSGASGETGGPSGASANFNAILMAHAIIAGIAFVILYPLGAMSMRLLSFNGLVWVHAGWMIFTYMLTLASMGMGVWIAVTCNQLDSYHAIIGLVVVGALLLQPITGLTHHLLYKRVNRKNVATYPHIWWGRAVITLGIINGGFGLQLKGNTRSGEVAYGVVAGIMWTLWMIVILVSFIRSRGKVEGETGGSVYDVERKSASDRGLRRSPSTNSS